jgi:TonB family protein
MAAFDLERYSRVLVGMLAPFVVIGRAGAHEPDVPASPGLTAPVLIERTEPRYPEAARQGGLGGVVGLELTIDEEGAVSEARVVHPAGFGFDEAAVEAARQFKFKPATRDGRPIAATVLFDQEFRIRPHIAAATSSEAAAKTEEPPASSPIPFAPTATAARPAYESRVLARGPATAASASTIRNLDFELRPRTSPGDLLRVVPGLLAVQHQGGGKADQLFLRGFDADHGTDVGVFIDGIPINLPSHAHGQGFADLHFLIPEAIERIDVVKGPYDVRWGDFSTAGAVNLVTRERFEGSSLQSTLGTLPTISGREVSQARFVGIASPELGERLHPWLAFEAASDDGPFATSEDLSRYNLFGKVSYDATPQLKVGSFFQAYGSGWTGSGQLPAREVTAGRLDRFGSLDPSEGGQTQRQMITAFARYRTGEDELTATVYLTRYRLSLWNDFTFFLKNPLRGDEIEQDDARIVTGARIQYEVERAIGEVSFRTTMGAEMRHDGIHVDRFDAESQNGDFRKRVARSAGGDLGSNGNNDDIAISDLAGYLNEDIVFSEHLRLTGGLRGDFIGFNVSDAGEMLGPTFENTSGVRSFTVLSPKAGAIISPLPSVLDLYLNAGEGFHTNMAEAALIDGRRRPDENGNPFTVRAVPRLYGGEAGARAHLFDRLDLAAALWYSYLQNETIFSADEGAFVPAPATKRIGFDLEARVRILSWLQADLDLAQAHATFAGSEGGNGGAVALAPKLYLTGGLTARHAGARGGVRFRFLGERPAFDEASPEYRYFTSKTLPDGRPNPDYDPSRVTAEGYLVVDAYIAYRLELDLPFAKAIEASVSVQNLFDAKWREAQFGNASCTRDETMNPNNPRFAGSGNPLADGRAVDRCGISFAADPTNGGKSTRSGVADVHFTPGVPLNVQLTLRALF